jgi:hypothetical protein
MNSIEAVFQRIAEIKRPLSIAECQALIDCARALQWRVLQSSFSRSSGHHACCGVELNSIDPCTCGADALKRLGEL